MPCHPFGVGDAAGGERAPGGGEALDAGELGDLGGGCGARQHSSVVGGDVVTEALAQLAGGRGHGSIMHRGGDNEVPETPRGR